MVVQGLLLGVHTSPCKTVLFIRQITAEDFCDQPHATHIAQRTRHAANLGHNPQSYSPEADL